MSNAITSFRGKYAFLSNMYTANVTYGGHTFTNSEAAFQSMKCPDRAREFCRLDAVSAKMLGRRVDIRPDWEDIKLTVMENVCRCKFTQDPQLAQLLLNTGDAELIEGNRWNDTYWGVCGGIGENNLGKILMRIRSELQEKTQHSLSAFSGKLIAIEGVDGSGKQTQAKLLAERLIQLGISVRQVSFPDYDSPSSGPVKMYLAGEFGTDPDDVSPYAASALYAVDRYASYKKDWSKFYLEGGTIVFDRYVGSNAIHQGSKCKTPEELDEYLSWLKDFEFRVMGIPEPSITIWLDMDPDESQRLMEDRLNKFSHEEKKDIHESNGEYLRKCSATGRLIADKWGWKKIDCIENGELLSVETIAEKIWSAIQKTV